MLHTSNFQQSPATSMGEKDLTQNCKTLSTKRTGSLRSEKESNIEVSSVCVRYCGYYHNGNRSQEQLHAPLMSVCAWNINYKHHIHGKWYLPLPTDSLEISLTYTLKKDLPHIIPKKA